MVWTRALWFTLVLTISLAELQCEWEYKPYATLGGWATNDYVRKTFPTLDEAKSLCIPLGDNCGGITFWNGGYSLRRDRDITDHSTEQSWRKSCNGNAPLFRVHSFDPYLGSRLGGSKITIIGQGFSKNQLDLSGGGDGASSGVGNKVIFYHKDEKYSPAACVVQTYYTTPDRIVCDLAKPEVFWDETLEYRLKISVDGTWMEPKLSTSIYCGGSCNFWFRNDHTPRVNSVESSHVSVGSLITLNTRMWTAEFEPTSGASSSSAYLSRVFLNSFTCDTSDSEGNSYGTALDKDKNGEDSSTGVIKCKSTKPGATSYRPSFFHSTWGRSEVVSGANKVDSQMQKYAIQTYNEIKSISPMSGSENGGTRITITSEHVTGPLSNIEAQIGGNKCEVESFTSTEIVCASPAKDDKTLSPGNRGVTVEYWTQGATSTDPVDIRTMTQEAENFKFEKNNKNTYPKSITELTEETTDEAYYVRMRFYLNIQETDFYGFHMISDFKGKLYVSTDHTLSNAVLKIECDTKNSNWDTLQTEVDTKLVAGMIYLVEFVGVLQNYGQHVGVGLTKKTTPHQPYEVASSRVDKPTWVWRQDYNDEIQEISLGGLVKTPNVGFKLKLGERETKELSSSSTVAEIAATITDTAIYKCPTLDATDAFWFSQDFEKSALDWRDYREPYCGREVKVSDWTLYHINYNNQIYEWDPSTAYKYICFALKTTKIRPSIYYELTYQDANYVWRNRGVWKDGDSMDELEDNDGTWKYHCINMEEQVKTKDGDFWSGLIGSRKYKIRKMFLGIDVNEYGEYNVDSIRISKTKLTEDARSKGFPLTGEGLLNTVKVAATYLCDGEGDDKVTCADDKTDEAVDLKWTVTMNSIGCGYNFPLIAVAGKTETVVTANTKASYAVGGETVVVERTAAITEELQGTFDLTIDGVTHSDIDVHGKLYDILAIIRENGDYKSATKQGSCYERQWQLQRTKAGEFGEFSVDSTKVIGKGTVTTVKQYSGQNLRGGLALTPVYGDWIREASSKPIVSLKVNGIQAYCDNSVTDIAFTYSPDKTPSVTTADLTGSRDSTLSIPGSGFGTSKDLVTVTMGGVQQTVTAVVDTAVSVTLGDGVSKVYNDPDVVVTVAGSGNAALASDFQITYVGSATSITPTSGGIGGGTVVTIAGDGFDKDSVGVTFNGAAGEVKDASHTQIEVAVPAGAAAGPATIVITGGAGYVAPDVSSLSFAWTDDGAATTTGIEPALGSISGGTEIKITGTGLDSVADDGVTIGGVICTKNDAKTSIATEFFCTTGPNAPGSKDVLLAKSNGERLKSNLKFEYLLKVNSVSPSEGSVVGGTRVTMTGAGFGTDKTKLYIELGEFECDVESVADDVLECVTQPAQTAHQIWSDYKKDPTCAGLTLSTLEQTAQTSHNMYREMHERTPNICYSHEIAKTAKSWAKYLIDNNQFKSSTTSYREKRGENLMKYEHWDLMSDEAYINEAIEAWYNTGSQYSDSDPSNSLFYTQIIWKMTSAVGCAVESNQPSTNEKYTVIIVCHYSTAGNVEGKFSEYVTDRDVTYHKTAKSLTSQSVAVNVFLDSRAAVLDSQATPTSKDSCQKETGAISGCADSPQAAGSTFDFTYHTCQTPKIESVSPDASAEGGALWDTPITIVGSGFSTESCRITVHLGDYECTVQSSTATQIICVADPAKGPPVNTKLPVKVNVYGRGDAVFEGEDYENIYTFLKPSITSIAGSEGSLKGGKSVVITGGGFEEGAIFSDGVSEFEVVSTSWSTATVRSKTGISESADTTKTIVMTQDGVPVVCPDTKCDFVYKVDKTPVITEVAVTNGEVDEYIIIIDGTNLCGDSDQTATLAVDTTFTFTSCNDTHAICTVTGMSSGTFSLEFENSNGFPDIPADKKVINIAYEISAVTPTSGSIYGGTTVQITGATLPNTFKVSTSQDIGYVTSNSASEITFTTSNMRQQQTAATTQIRLDNKQLVIGGTGQMFEFKSEETPTISSISPTSGTKGDVLTITGSNFLDTKTSVELSEMPLSGNACQNQDLTINCGDDFISIHQAHYGVVPYMSVCNVVSDGNPNCDNPDSFAVVQRECEGRHNCTVRATNTMFGDPCVGRSKYLRATWGCYAVEQFPSSGPRAVESPKTCAVQTVTDTQITCTLPNYNRIGTLQVLVKVDPYGNSNSEQSISYTMALAGTLPATLESGSLGGPVVQLRGSGFLSLATVKVCDVTVNLLYTVVDISQTEKSDQLEFKLPACPSEKCPDGNGKCSIKVTDFDGNTLEKTDHVTYVSSKTPTINQIDPSDAGTGGGKTITISGSSLTDQTAAVSVKFDGVSCVVTSATVTEIVCTTGAKLDLSNKDGVEVKIDDSLAKNPNDLTMTYKDLWSSRFTWGGDLKNKPVEGDLAVIQKGQIVYLDESPPLLKGILLNGGHLVFDDNQDVKLMMEYMIILGDGSMTIGTEESPFEHQAEIEMYGHQQSTELPMYGAKTIAVRHGTVEMHGKPVTPAWCDLGETAEPGSSTIVIKQKTNWQVGDEIAISPSGFAPEEHEYNKIAAIDYVENTDTTTITLEVALQFKHISTETTANGVKIKAAAKIGHLTRNVKLRGNVNKSHLEVVDACPQSFDPDQFATQTCFQGRYGEELDSDQFGSQIMFHAAAMGTREVHGRLENVEVTWAGQAFRLGRYPIHFHMNGDVSGSYVKGCAIHHTFNRAVTVHGVDNLLVENNVAYNNMGHAFFLEDGGEENNVFRGNLAIFTKSSSSLLNVDVTPASFWIVNPVNTFENNVAAGSTHFGFWFNMPQHPGGPSFDNTICPRNKGMLSFKGNEAHSCGRYGIWVWEFWNPRGDGSCEATEPKMTTLEDFHGWHNLRGVEVEEGSGIEMKNFVLHDNWISQMEVHKCFDASFDEGNTRMTNSLIVAKTSSSDGLSMRYLGDEVYKCGTGVVIPGKGDFSVHDSYFKDFTECEVFTACGGCRKPLLGGFISEFKGIQYENSPRRGAFKWEFEAILRDVDGSLIGTNKANGIISPDMAVLDKESCTEDAAWSHGAIKGVTCDSKTNLVRLAWNNPSLSYLAFKEVILKNKHGEVTSPWVDKRLTHKKGWMATVPTGYSYDMKWNTDKKFTNASFAMSAYYPNEGDYLIIKQELAGKPDYITVGGSSNKKLTSIEPTDDTGTFNFDDETKILSHIITGKGITEALVLPMDLKVYKCFYENCTDPHPKALPANPALGERPETPKKWTVSSDWVGTEEGWGGFDAILPRAGQDVQIPASWWMVYDAQMEGLGNIFVYGVLEFSNEKDTLLGANRIIVVGGKIVLGWKEDPLKFKATIKLTGNRDDDEYTMNDGTIVGSKALAIMGFAEMHCSVPDVLWSTTTAKAAKGTSTLTLKDDVEGKWNVGDEIAIASTSYLPSQAEKKKITQIAGNTLTLDSPLEYDHDYLLDEVNGHQYERTAEVGLLTRSITIEGVEDAGHTTQYGVRVLVSDYSQRNEAGEEEQYIPEVMIQGVQFKNSGQQGYRDYFDPRYSLALQNTNHAVQSYVKDCSVNEGFNHGIGVISSPRVQVYNNVIYKTIGSGVISNSPDIDIQGNVVMNVMSFGNYEDPIEKDNYFMDACFETYETDTAIIKGNNCGGSERACFSTMGGDGAALVFENNVAHGCLWGIFIRKSSKEITKITNVRVWQNYDYGLVHWSKSSLEIAGSIFADNAYSILPMIVGPSALSHEIKDMHMTISNTLIYGRHENSECTERQDDRPPTAKLTGIGYIAPATARGKGQGRLGLYMASFTGGWTGWPTMPIQGPHTYPTVNGLSTISGVTFANFHKCDDTAIMDLRSQGDLFHPTKMEKITFVNTDKSTSSFLTLNNPILGFINSADCVDMPCDARKKVLITDMDGSVLGKAGDSLTSRSEYQWDSGDERWGMGDYRLPNTMTTLLNGTNVPGTNWPYKGIDRNGKDPTVCIYKEAHNMYHCTGITYKMLVIESMDGDTEIRRLSPVVLATEDGSVDLINGPQDHGWCGGYTCQERVSTFYAMVIVGKTYRLYLTSTQPQSMRYFLVDAAAGDSIRLDVWYAKSQRLDMYYQSKYKAPTNAQKKSDGTYSYATDKTAEELYPKITDAAGTNFFDSKAHWMSMLIKGASPFTIKTSPKIVLSLTLESVDGSNFFDEDKIVANLAALLGVPKEKIKIAKIVAEGRRKRSGQEFEVEISNPPVDDESSMDESVVTEMAEDLTKASEKLVETVQQGKLGEALEAQVTGVAIEVPEIPPKVPVKLTQEDAERVTETTYAEKQADEAEVSASAQGSVAILIPSAYKLVDKSDEVELLTNLAVRSKVVTSDDDVVPLLGAGEGTWKAQMTIKSGPSNGRLLGTKEVVFNGGYGNLTNVRLSRKGTYKLSLAVSHPATIAYEIEDLSIKITEQAEDSPLKRVVFSFDGDYSAVVANDEAGFTAYMRSQLKAKYPDLYFDDIDHYAGSVVVEATVSTSSGTKSDTQLALSRIAEDTESNGMELSYNGQSLKLASFSQDAEDKSIDVVAIVVPVVVVMLLVGAALGGWYHYTNKNNKINSPIVTMTDVKEVEDNDHKVDGGNVYSNSVAVKVDCESNEAGPNDNFNKNTRFVKSSTATAHSDSEKLLADKTETISAGTTSVKTDGPISELRRRSLQKVWGAINRMEVPADSDYKCFEDISAEEPAQNWRNFQHDIAECTACGSTTKTWPCPICHGPQYCSKDCLDKNWPEHHTDCRPRSAKSAESDM